MAGWVAFPGKLDVARFNTSVLESFVDCLRSRAGRRAIPAGNRAIRHHLAVAFKVLTYVIKLEPPSQEICAARGCQHRREAHP